MCLDTTGFLGNYIKLLIDHFPHRRYIEEESEDLAGML
jgi:hypothetical protein